MGQGPPPHLAVGGRGRGGGPGAAGRDQPAGPRQYGLPSRLDQRPAIRVPAVQRLPASPLGGIVILLRPDVPVSIDSRNDLYGRQDVLAEQRILTASSGGPGSLQRLGVNCVLIPGSSGLARQLLRSPGWRQVTTNPAATVFLRRDLGGSSGAGH